MKERRKEIENARKRRHQSDSESEEEQDRKPRKSKKEGIVEKISLFLELFFFHKSQVYVEVFNINKLKMCVV